MSFPSNILYHPKAHYNLYPVAMSCSEQDFHVTILHRGFLPLPHALELVRIAARLICLL